MRSMRVPRPATTLLLAFLLPACVGAQVPNAAPGGPDEALRTGRYDEAIAGYRALATAPDAPVSAHRGLVRALRETGEYGEAIDAARRGEELVGPALSVALGDALLDVGRLDEAAAAFQRGAVAGSPDRLTAIQRGASLRLYRGDRAGAMEEFEQFFDFYRDGLARTSRDLVAVGVAMQELGVREPVLRQDALRAFDEAAAADPGDPEPHLRMGDLFVASDQGGDAQEAYGVVLAVNPRNPRALVGRARALETARQGGAVAAVEAALEVNPSSVEALVLRGEQHLRVEVVEEAGLRAREALEVDPSSLGALALLASVRWLQGDDEGFQGARRRALAVNPAFSGLYVALSDAATNTRRYAAAVDFARQGVELDSLDWQAHGLLGVNRLRIGNMEEGRASIERAFAGIPSHVGWKNTLDLLDSLEGFVEVSSGPFTLVLREDEAELMAPLVAEVAEEAWGALTRAYAVSPDVPVRVELYPISADFSVRTLGISGIGALGVAFGPVLAMDSPSARRPGEFNWASTLWHELAHVVHLGVSRSAMPRWLGEGLAVYEQRQARPGWGPPVSPGLLRAYQQGMFPALSRLNEAFVRPTYPEQIGHAYVLASIFCDWVAATAGAEALGAMLRAYGTGQDNEEVFRSVLGMEPDELDQAFDAYMKERFRVQLASLSEARGAGPPPTVMDAGLQAAERPGDYRAQLIYGTVLFQEERYQEAIPVLERARELLPEYSGDDGPDWMLARIHLTTGDRPRAREALERLLARNESHLEGARALADLLSEDGELDGASAALNRAVEIYPMAPDLHRERAVVEERRGDWNRVVSARRAILALAPVDRAAAHYELARALTEAGEGVEARRQVLRALEIAPAYEEAQDLLLRLRGSEE
jgi:cellulose synthase operon protein C